MRVNKYIIILLLAFSCYSGPLTVKIDIEPARFIPHIFQYHFQDYGQFMHTQSSLWFEKPNIINIDLEIYHYAWEEFKKNSKTQLTEEQAINAAQMRMQNAINKIASQFYLPPTSYQVKLIKTAQNKFEAPSSWINFTLE